MEISRKDQAAFAKEIITLVDIAGKSPEQVEHLNRLVSLLVSWVSEDNGVAVNLSEYIGELNDILHGERDTGWLAEFKKALDKDIQLIG
jgi:hypothetical protein